MLTILAPPPKRGKMQPRLRSLPAAWIPFSAASATRRAADVVRAEPLRRNCALYAVPPAHRGAAGTRRPLKC